MKRKRTVDPNIENPKYQLHSISNFIITNNPFERFRYKKKRLPDSYSYIHTGTKPTNERFNYFPKRIKEYERSAEVRNLEWRLDNKTASDLFGSSCFYCNRNGPGGIDRINSNIGYIPQNVVACCSQCNYAKGRLSAEEFIRMAHQISNNLTIQEGIDLDEQTINMS